MDRVVFEDVGRIKQFEDGAVVFSENEPGRSMFVVESGRIRRTRTATHESEEIVTPLAEIGPGAFFGEMALFDVARRSPTATAVGDVQLRKVSRKDLEAGIRANPEIALQFLERMSKRIRKTDALIERLLVREKLAEDVFAEVSALRHPESFASTP
ncbi:MAG: cyclic nucleotide-binding domain-containing protein [Actinomycetota bacterium]|nr:cyclic nucleotide-binding domain-containing protein [Actinomycetota bacterium]